MVLKEKELKALQVLNKINALSNIHFHPYDCKNQLEYKVRQKMSKLHSDMAILLSLKISKMNHVTHLGDGPLDHGPAGQGGAVHLLLVVVRVVQVLGLHLVADVIPTRT